MMSPNNDDTTVVEDWFGRYCPPTTESSSSAAATPPSSLPSPPSSQSQRQPIRRFTLTNANQMTVQVITYGATITSIKVPDKHGNVDDVVLGFDQIGDYYTHKNYFGSTIGRFGNRISGGKFSLGGRQYRLACNNGQNHLHGGIRGFDKVLWDSHVEGSTIILSYRSPDGEEGYPGEVITKVSFELTADNELVIRYLAKASKPTPMNLTNHSYFNIAGHASGDVSDHRVWLNAEHYLPVNDALIPSGEIATVEGTLFDLRAPVRLGDVLSKIPPCGYDHNFCVQEDSKTDEEGRRLVARVEHPGTGRVMEVLSTLPGVQFYTGGGLPTDDSLKGKGGIPYRRFAALCLETQYFPDSVNHSNFPNCIFGPGEDFEATTIYKFSTL